MAEEAVLDTGAAGVSDATETALDTVESPVIGDGGNTDVAEVQEDQQQTDGQDDAASDTDGEITSAHVKSHIEELKKSNPALAKELKNLYFANDALRKEVPGGLAEVRQLKQAVNDLGGTEGIEQIRAQQAEWEQIDSKFAAGDATVLEEFAKFNPEGFAKLIPAAVDKLSAIDKATYDHTLAGPFVSTLDSWRLPDTISRIAETLSQIVDAKGNPLCTREIQQLAELGKKYDSLRELSQNAPKKQVDEAAKKIQEREAELAAKEARFHGEYVANQTQTHAQKQYEALLPTEARNQGLDLARVKAAGAYERFMSEIDEDVAREIIKDKQTTDKINASIAAGRRDEAVKLSNAKFDKIYAKSVQTVVRRWSTLTGSKGIAGKTTAKTGTTTTPAGVKQLDGPPDTNLIDKTSPTWRDDYMMKSTAKLKTGQRVKW